MKRTKPLQRKTRLVAHAPLKRTTPMRRVPSRKWRDGVVAETVPAWPKRVASIRVRNVKRRPPSLANAQRKAVLARAGGRCEFEVYEMCGDGRRWTRCFVYERQERLDVAHVVRRWKHPAPPLGESPLVYHPDVAIAACRNHHTAYDQRKEGASDKSHLRVPVAYRAATYAHIRGVEAARKQLGIPCARVSLIELFPLPGVPESDAGEERPVA